MDAFVWPNGLLARRFKKGWSEMWRKVLQWLRDRELPTFGFVVSHDGQTFGWNKERPEPKTVVPGVIVVSIDDRSQMVACGGNAASGVERWEALAARFGVPRKILEGEPSYSSARMELQSFQSR